MATATWSEGRARAIHRDHLGVALVSLLFLAGFAALVFMPITTAAWVTREDGPVETIGAFAFLAASLLFLLTFLRGRGEHYRFLSFRTRGNLYFLLLAVLFFVFFGEEISWGQRFFGWATPEVLEQTNIQDETNLHNLWFMQQGAVARGLSLLSTHRILNLFCLAYVVLLPLLHRRSAAIRRLTAFAGWPVPWAPLAILFIANYVASKAASLLAHVDLSSPISELYETNYALAFLILALCFLWGRGSVSAAPDAAGRVPA
jgi:hypothetical protein